mmetsp:Transcript_51692/g.78504  ORF Transcript_51692/g.78504 Transcript_51692/m.78504 type:complete len:213 (-) Transcript_51692:1260-1898(-)
MFSPTESESLIGPLKMGADPRKSVVESLAAAGAATVSSVLVSPASSVLWTFVSSSSLGCASVPSGERPLVLSSVSSPSDPSASASDPLPLWLLFLRSQLLNIPDRAFLVGLLVPAEIVSCGSGSSDETASSLSLIASRSCALGPFASNERSPTCSPSSSIPFSSSSSSPVPSGTRSLLPRFFSVIQLTSLETELRCASSAGSDTRPKSSSLV